jgi:hypothetical protein
LLLKERRIIRNRAHQLKFTALLAIRRSGEALNKAETFAEKRRIVDTLVHDLETSVEHVLGKHDKCRPEICKKPDPIDDVIAEIFNEAVVSVWSYCFILEPKILFEMFEKNIATVRLLITFVNNIYYSGGSVFQRRNLGRNSRLWLEFYSFLHIHRYTFIHSYILQIYIGIEILGSERRVDVSSMIK